MMSKYENLYLGNCILHIYKYTCDVYYIYYIYIYILCKIPDIYLLDAPSYVYIYIYIRWYIRNIYIYIYIYKYEYVTNVT